MTFKYSAPDRSIDDKIVSEALGSERVVIEAVDATPSPKPAKAEKGVKGKSRTRKALGVVVAGAALLLGAGVFLGGGQAPKLSPELVALLENGKGAVPAPEEVSQQPAPDLSAPVQPEDEVPPAMDAVTPLAVQAAPPSGAPAAPALKGSAAPSVAPSMSPVDPVVPVAAPVASDQSLLLSLKHEVEQLKKTVAALEQEKIDLKDQVAALKKPENKPVAAPVKPAPKVVPKPKPVAKPVASKPAVEPVKKVMAILSDGIVLHDGDVIDVGTSSPKVGGKLTGVSPATGAIEVNGEARHVVVDPN